ncbi:hypothetical protein GF351_00850 [Candidatus Woesearchaeota archaeon]|nr:hypothetical protein [Candidatus Woesearchaeota archaeon]
MDIKERIISIIRSKGPVIPVQIAKELETNMIFASAHLSELVRSGEIRITQNLRIGGSPLYYLQGQEYKLQDFAEHLNEKDQKALELLKQNKVLKDREQTPLIQVALRSIKDFAVPLQVTHNDDSKEIFWKFYLMSTDNASRVIQSRLRKDKKKVEAPQPHVQHGAEAAAQDQENAGPEVMETKPKYAASPEKEASPAGQGDADKHAKKEGVVWKDKAGGDSIINPEEEQDKTGFKDNTKDNNNHEKKSADEKKPSDIREKPNEKEQKDKHIRPKPKTSAVKKENKTQKEETKEKKKCDLKDKNEEQSSPFVDTTISDPFAKQAREFFSRNRIAVLQNSIVKKKTDIDFVIEVPSPLGPLPYYCKARKKKRINDGDISQAFLQGQLRKLPVMFLTTGELTKKAKAMIQKDFKGIVVRKL